MIPREFHFVFGLREQTEPFHLMHYLCLASCLAVGRPDAVHVHCLNRPWGPLWDLIQPRIQVEAIDPARLRTDLHYADPAIARFAYAHLADFLRLEILLERGGIYADMDTLFLRPVPAAMLAADCVMGRETVDAGATGAVAGGSLCNALIMARPGAPFVALWLDRMRDAFDGSWSSHSTFLPFALSREHPDLIHVVPEAAFFALDWTRDGLADLFDRRVELPASATSLHLWAHLWWDPARQDWSRFSHRRLTPAYVRHARTTYAEAARPFLPDHLHPSRARWLLERAMGLVRP
jgi:hypothetical protein